jgi:hypothetical protein
MSDKDKKRGLYQKFHVRRLSDTKRKHLKCRYFVLDLDHDEHAIPALKAYIRSCADDFPALAKDLEGLVMRRLWP